MIKVLKSVGLIGGIFLSATVLAADSGNIVSIAETVTKQANAVSKLLSIVSYVSGVGFALAGILQFKAHKENPQQVPLSKPVVLMAVAACLLFLPTILTVAGSSVFGDGTTSAAKAGKGEDLSGS